MLRSGQAGTGDARPLPALLRQTLLDPARNEAHVIRSGEVSAASGTFEDRMKHWRIEQLDWDAFDATKVDPEIIPIVKAASVVERNSLDYAAYLNNVFIGDPDFAKAADAWAVEEVQHGDALGKWAMLADPTWTTNQHFSVTVRLIKLIRMSMLPSEAPAQGS